MPKRSPTASSRRGEAADLALGWKSPPPHVGGHGTANPYESGALLAQYLLFHYGQPEEILPYPFGPRDALGFPARCVAECLDAARLPAQARALDLGCAVGRASFELARHCESVVGIDFSRQFIAAAASLKQRGRLASERIEEGNLATKFIAVVPPDIDRRRVTFQVGDATALREDLGEFDVVLAANLIDRLSHPLRCLRRLPQLVKPGGQLILTSPYTWLDEFTPAANWLGGFRRRGQRVRAFDTLRRELGPAFKLASRKDLPFLIREHARKFQWGVAEATVWIRLE